MTHLRRWTLLVAGGATFAGALIWTNPTAGHRFDAVTWQRIIHSDASTFDRLRLEMADDLVLRSLLDGKPRSEVISMLGPPRQTDYFDEWDLVYRLGMERGFISIDSEWLVVRFDASDHVAEYQITRD